MFRLLISFLLVNCYYQSLGNPIQQNLSISDSLVDLTKKCENSFLANVIKSKVKECDVSIVSPTLYNTKQIRCLIFYDINKQLCSAVPGSKALADDFKSKIVANEDINIVCTSAKDWIFTDLPEYANYKNSSERLMKSLVTCGEICGVEDAVNDANIFCKYYKWGIGVLKNEVLKAPVSTENNVNNNNVEPPAAQESELNPKGDIAVPVNGNSLKPQVSNTAEKEKTKQTQLVVPHLPSDVNVAKDISVTKSTVQASNQPSIPNSPNNGKNEEEQLNVNVQKPVIMPAIDINDQAAKPVVNTAPKPEVQNDPLLPNNDLLDQNEVLTNNDGNASNDAYSDDIDGDDEDAAGTNVKSPPVKQESSHRNNLPSSNGDLPQKDYFPSSDSFADDGDNFFPFFLSGVIMVVLLYVLYHNKNKVTKVFFGLILEGRQSNRRRNSRGHAYRRLDTLEQAMSANTAAPPSKIIY